MVQRIIYFLFLRQLIRLFRQRLPSSHVFYYRSPIHQNHYVLSFAFAFEKEDEVYQFAVAPPYSFSRLQSYLGVIENKYLGLFVRTELAKSLVNIVYVCNCSSSYNIPGFFISKEENLNYLRLIMLNAPIRQNKRMASGLSWFLSGLIRVSRQLRSFARVRPYKYNNELCNLNVHSFCRIFGVYIKQPSDCQHFAGEFYI